jgi:3-hydroxyisobutyrate dehydrogenase-like beta-hydroxyacid dehydrogenase
LPDRQFYSREQEDLKMSTKTVALLYPGNMGSTIGAAAATSGARVIWASQERSKETQERARKAGLIDVGSMTQAVRESDVILAVCPPHAAAALAKSVAALKFSGIYLDANAISRSTAEQVGEIVTKAGASFVDGGIIGPPVTEAGKTRLYLSGSRASEVAALFAGSMLDARPIGDKPGQASVLKIAYAAWTKGSDMLLLAIRALAVHEGVEQALIEEWGMSIPALVSRSARAAALSAPKAWRFVGEMREIAETFKSVGLPTGFHDAAAEICERLAPFKGYTEQPPTVPDVVNAILAPSGKGK